MPSNMLAIDTNFPTFTGEEPVEEQISSLVNYLYQLRESLQYSLQNLTTENFNASALENLSEEAKGEIGKQLGKIENELNQLSQTVRSIEGRLSGVDALSSKVSANETDISNLKDNVTDLTARTENLEEQNASMAGSLEQLTGFFSVDENGAATIGKADVDLKLVGNVYINGVLFTGESAGEEPGEGSGEEPGEGSGETTGGEV